MRATAALLLLTSAFAHAQHWEFEQVDTALFVSRVQTGASASGIVALCYADGSGLLRCAYKDSCWHYESPCSVPPAVRWSFAVGPHGEMGILYGDTDPVLLEWTQSGWEPETLVWSPWSSSFILAYDSAGRPAVAHHKIEFEWYEILYAVRTDSGWLTDYVYSAGGLYNECRGPYAFRTGWTTNRAAVAYISGHFRTPPGVWVGRASSGSPVTFWNQDWAMGDMNSGQLLDVAPFASDSSAVCHVGGGHLSCRDELVDARLVGRARVVVDPADRPHIVYPAGGRLVHAWRQQPWRHETVTSEPVAVYDLTLAADGEPLLALAWNGCLWLAWRRYADHDVGISGLSPLTVMLGDSVVPTATVRNLGLNIESFQVTLRIDSGPLQTRDVSSLQPGDSALVAFDVWIPYDSGTVTFRGRTVLGDDEWPANDTLGGEIVVLPVGVGEVRATDLGAPFATIYRGVLLVSSDVSILTSLLALLDASGRRVLSLKPGANDVSSLPPGVYFVRQKRSSGQAAEWSSDRVVITK